MEAGWSAKRVARQLGRSDCVVRCWDQWIREISFTRRPGSGRSRQTSRREDRHIAPGLRTFGIAVPVTCAALDAHPWTPPYGVEPCTRKQDGRGMEPGVRVKRVRVWSSILPLLYSDTPLPHLCDGMGCHCLQYTVTPIIDPWHHMPAQQYVHAILQPHGVATHATAPRSHFSTRQCSASHGKGVTRLSLHCYYPSLACPFPRFVSNQAYLGSFGMASWAFHEFERTRGIVTANME
ncbi:transposable element Tcb2 transposase [Trichonephila clavipes]|nr:transposable element Tcb2 transposase [Trichonephila clavipes]